MTEIIDLCSPGEILAETLAERNLTVKEFSKLSRISEPQLNGLMAKKPWPLSKRCARKIAQALKNISVEFWYRLEFNYRMDLLIQRRAKAFAEIFGLKAQAVQGDPRYIDDMNRTAAALTDTP